MSFLGFSVKWSAPSSELVKKCILVITFVLEPISLFKEHTKFFEYPPMQHVEFFASLVESRMHTIVIQSAD